VDKGELGVEGDGGLFVLETVTGTDFDDVHGVGRGGGIAAVGRTGKAWVYEPG
jgi:hypothetical protein